MKKTLIFLSTVALAAVMSSCSKTCHCTNYFAGETMTMDYTLKELQEDYPNENIQKCSDLDLTGENAGIRVGMECK